MYFGVGARGQVLDGEIPNVFAPPFRRRLLRNLVPLPYRRVSVQRYVGEMTPAALQSYLLGKEAYRRTEYIVMRQDGATAVVTVTTTDRESLFGIIQTVDVLALPQNCTFAEMPKVDPGIPSSLAAAALELGVGPQGTLVVSGKYDHVNFIHHPDPTVVRVVEVVPPEPPKLYELAQQVLGYAALPPIHLELERIDIREKASTTRAAAFLVPCRVGGLDRLHAPVYFLDERPERQQDWLMIGCQRSLEFHRHFYGDEPSRIEMCPRQIAVKRRELTLLKCCLLEDEIELDGHIAVTPWGADIGQVEMGLRRLIEAHVVEVEA